MYNGGTVYISSGFRVLNLVALYRDRYFKLSITLIDLNSI